MSDNADPAERLVPGEIAPGGPPVVANAGRRMVTLRVRNTSVWPVHVSSHYHFFEANRRLRFDRAAAFGMRLDILAGATVRWEPGEETAVRLVEYAGRREVHGFNGLVDGPLTPEAKTTGIARLRERGFLDSGAFEDSNESLKRGSSKPSDAPLMSAESLGNSPSRFVQAVARQGAVGAVRNVIHCKRVPAGFGRLEELGRLDLSLWSCSRDGARFSHLLSKISGEEQWTRLNGG